MGKKKEADAAAAPGKATTVAVAISFAVLGALVGPKVLGGGAAPAAAVEETTTSTVSGPVVVLDAITLNLADGHLLQVGLALELRGEVDGEHAEAGDDDPTRGFAKALDAAIDVLGDQTMASLAAPGGRDAAKAALAAALEELYDGEISGVYFHQFVMQ